jgi:hypothetical protein
MIALSRMPVFGFVVLAFLLLCTILAVAAWFATRGTVDPGKTRISPPAGCAIGCALLVVAGLGALATAMVVVVNLPAEWARNGPIERMELRYDGPRPGEDEDAGERREGRAAERADAGSGDAERDGSGGGLQRVDPRVYVEIELRPGYDAAPILRLLRDEVSSGLDVTVRSVEREGVARTVIGIGAPLDEEARAELDEALRELREELPELNLPTGIVLEIRGPND